MDGDGRQIQLARDPLLVMIDLKVDPQVRRGAEEAAEPQRHFDRDGLFLGEDAVNRLARHAKRGGDVGDAHLQLRQRLLAQHAPRMHRRHEGEGRRPGVAGISAVCFAGHVSGNPLYPD